MRHVVLCSYQHASDISAGQRECLSIHSAGNIRDVCATRRYIQVPLEKRNNKKALLSHAAEELPAGQHAKISRYYTTHGCRKAHHVAPSRSVTLVSSSALTDSGLLASEWLASCLPCIAHSCPWGEAPTAQTQKAMLVVARKPRLYLAASNINPGRRPSNDHDRMASPSSARPKHGTHRGSQV